MEQPRTVPLTYARETYRLWFEYLKVALDSRHPEVIQGLKASEAYYLPWEVTPETKFDPWWKTHRHLFAENQLTIGPHFKPPAAGWGQRQQANRPAALAPGPFCHPGSGGHPAPVRHH